MIFAEISISCSVEKHFLRCLCWVTTYCLASICVTDCISKQNKLCLKNRQVVGGADECSGRRVVHSLMHSLSTLFVEKVPRVLIGQGFFSFGLGFLLLAKDFSAPPEKLDVGSARIS